MAKVLRDHQILKWSYFGLAVAMAGYFLAGSSWQMWAIIPVFTFFNGLNMANQTSLISRSAEMGRQGEAMGISSSVMNLAQVPASVLVGYITGSITSNTPLVVSTACIAAAGLVFLLFFRPTYVNDTPGAGAPGSGDGHVAQAH
jgi:predicted MFS family arabinose efflux permease